MEIEKEITKEVFERYCPAAKSPERNTSVYNRVLPIIRRVYDNFIQIFVGDDYKDKFEESSNTKDWLMAYVCNCAFYRAISSLDLVLTGTGFGIVNTNDTSPASQTRVQALKDNVEWNTLNAWGILISDLTRIEGWGKTNIATAAIRELYWTPNDILYYGPKFANMSMGETWKQIKTLRHSSESKVAQEISNEYYLVLLERIRTNELTEADRILLNKALDFEAELMLAIQEGKDKPLPKFYGLRDYMEQYIDQFPTYKESKLYAYLHGEKYENKQDDPTFFFTV